MSTAVLRGAGALINAYGKARARHVGTTDPCTSHNRML